MYIWRGKNRRDRRENKLQGLFGWRAHPSVRNERLEDDILRQEQEEIHVGYFHQNIRVIMHNYLNSKNGLLEVSRIIGHLDEMAMKKAVEEAEAAALESGEKFDKTKIVAVPAEIKKRSNVYEVFRKYDADGGGTLDMEELTVLLEELKIFMTEEELENLFDELDEDGEGGIDFEEFYNWFTAEADKQRKKNVVGYVVNAISEGVFDGFRRLVMEVEARNLSLDHAVWSAERDARAEFRIVHPPRFKCEVHTCGMSFPTHEQYRKHKDDVEGHEILDRDHEELVGRFHNMELFLAGPLGRISLANRLLFSRELASQETRIKAAELTPYRPATLDPEHKRQAQQLSGMMVTGYDPKMGLRSAPRKRGLKTQHLAPGKTREQQALSDVISSLLHCRDESIDIVSAPTTSQHADVVFTWKGFAANKIEVMGNFNGWKGESLSPYLQIPAPPDAASTIEDDIKTIESESSKGSKSQSTYNDVAASNQVKKSLTFGRSSIIKHLGPGKYLYKYRVDGEEKLDEHASVTVDPVTGKEVNILLVINPILHHDNAKPKDDQSTTVVGSQDKHDQKFGHLVHLNSLHTPEYKAKRNEEVGGMTKVNLRNMSLFDDGAWAFASFMQRNSLIQVLDVSFNSISDDGMQAIATALPLLTQLHTLKANGNGFGYDGVRYICGPLKKSQTIKTLELSGNNIGDDGAEIIAKVLLPMHKYLRELYVDDNKIGNDGAKELGEGLLHNKYLETFSISKNLIYTDGCRTLCFAVQSNGVMKRLRLDNNPLGAAGARHVGEMLLMNDSLEYVDVSNIDLNRAKDGSGFTMINSAVEKNKVLQYLLLRNNGISDLQAVDIIQAIKANLSITHIDLEGNPISAHFFKPNHFFDTKLGRATPSITTRLFEIQEIKRNPDAKKYKGKPREVDPEEDGRWTWRRKWKKIDRKAEIRRQKAAAGAEEQENIELEKEYSEEQLEKYLVGVEAFLDNPDCEIFLSTIARLLLQHVKEMHRLVLPEEVRVGAGAGAGADDASVGSMHSGSEASLFSKKLGSGVADETKSVDDQSVASGVSNGTQATNPSAGSGAKAVMTTRQRKELEAKLAKEAEAEERRGVKHGRDEDGMIPWDDQHFNSVHVALCKAIFIDLGADLSSLFLPFLQMERALNMMCLPCNQVNLQKAVWACQVTNQPLISFKKFMTYTKENAKNIVKGAGFKRMRIQTDLYFRPPTEEAKAIILDHYRYSAKIDIRKNYRAQLEHAPAFVCPTCHERFINQKSFDRHMDKGPRNTEHKRQILAKSIHEAQTYFLRKSKFLVTGTYFPAFFELVPEHNLIEDYIPQVFDSMGEEGRPVGTVEPHEVQLVEDVLGDWLQISYEGRMGWVKYQLPHEKERYRRVLHKACVHDVPYFSWDKLQVHSKPIYYQVRNDPMLPSTFELKVRLRPVLDSEVVGTLYKGMIVEARAHVGDWLQVRYQNHDAAWVVMKVGGGQWKPPLTRLELKKKRQAEEEARKEKERIRAEKIKALKAAQIKKRGKAKPIKLKDDDEKEVIIPAGELGADTVTVLHECVQRRMTATMAYSPYSPSKEELEVPEDWNWMEADRLEEESQAAMEDEVVDDRHKNDHHDDNDSKNGKAK